MLSSSGCWYSIFLGAYTYSTNYLLFTITIVVTSVILLWIYEKPQLYKLIFKRSKHSNIISPMQSDAGLEINYNTIMDHEVSGNLEEKKIQEEDPEAESFH